MSASTEGKRAKWIRVHATCLPRSLGGRFHAVCANVRCLWLVVRSLTGQTFDSITKLCVGCRFVAQSRHRRCLVLGSGIHECKWFYFRAINESHKVPLPLALLKLFKQKTLFYCHFPDCLLASHDTKLRWLYRLPIDYLEEACIGMVRTMKLLVFRSHSIE